MEIDSLVFLKSKMNGWTDSSYHLMIHQQYLLRKHGYQVILSENDFFSFDSKECYYYFNFDAFIKELKNTMDLFFIGFLRYPSIGDEYEITIHYNNTEEKHMILINENNNKVILNQLLSDNHGKLIKVIFKITEFGSKNKSIYDKTLDVEYDNEAKKIIQKFHIGYQDIDLIIPPFLRDNDFLRTMGVKGMDMTVNNWRQCFSIYLKDKVNMEKNMANVNYYIRTQKIPTLKYNTKLILTNPPRYSIINNFKIFKNKVSLMVNFIKFQIKTNKTIKRVFLHLK